MVKFWQLIGGPGHGGGPGLPYGTTGIMDNRALDLHSKYADFKMTFCQGQCQTKDRFYNLWSDMSALSVPSLACVIVNALSLFNLINFTAWHFCTPVLTERVCCIDMQNITGCPKHVELESQYIVKNVELLNFVDGPKKYYSRLLDPIISSSN